MEASGIVSLYKILKMADLITIVLEYIEANKAGGESGNCTKN